jgi:hypothetical protein
MLRVQREEALAAGNVPLRAYQPVALQRVLRRAGEDSQSGARAPAHEGAMSKHRTPRNACSGKSPFSTAAAARESARYLKKNVGGIGRLEVYKCEFCGSYHFGGKKKPSGQR